MRNWKREVVYLCRDIEDTLRDGAWIPVLLTVIIMGGGVIAICSLHTSFSARHALQENAAKLNSTLDDLALTTKHLGYAVDQLADTIDKLGSALEEVDEKTLAHLDASTKKLEEHIDKLRPKEK